MNSCKFIAILFDMAGIFPGIPAGSALERKMEDCVLSVKRQGHDKRSAIRICRASIKKEVKMVSKMSKKARQRRKELRRKENLLALKEAEEFSDELDALEDLADEELADILNEESDGDIPEEEDDDFPLGEDFALPDELEEDDEEEEEDNSVDYSPKSLKTLYEKQHEDALQEEFKQVAIDTENVISNIINDPIMEIHEKGRGIRLVADEMKILVDSLLGKTEELTKENFDYDIVSTEILAKEATLLDQTKAVLSTTSRSGLSDSQFALVYTGKNGKKVRKYPIHDKAHVRNALARAAQMLKRGGKAADDARRALPKIRAAAKRMGIGQPSNKNYNGFIIEKDAKGDYRWVGWPTNNREDRDRDFLIDAGHKEFVEFLEKTSQWKITFLPWHQKQYAFKHPVDAWMYKNGFMIYSGKLEEDEAIRLMNVARKEKLGMSHGFIPIKRNEQDKHIIEKFRTFEVSVLPMHSAANPFTSIEVISKEANIVNKEEYLRELLGEENFEQLAKDTEFQKNVLDALGVGAKDVKDLEKQKDSEDVLTKEEKVTFEKISKALGIDELSKAFKDIKDELVEGREERTAMGSLIKALLDHQKALETKKQEEADDTLAEMISKYKHFPWMDARSSQKDDTIVKDDDPDAPLLKAKPEDMWLSKITGTEPLSKKFVEENLKP